MDRKLFYFIQIVINLFIIKQDSDKSSEAPRNLYKNIWETEIVKKDMQKRKQKIMDGKTDNERYLVIIKKLRR